MVMARRDYILSPPAKPGPRAIREQWTSCYLPSLVT